jgi:hypothetical protein
LELRSTITDQPGLHSLYKIGSGGTTAALTTGRSVFAAGLTLLAAARFTAARLTVARFAEVRLLGRLLRRPVDRVVLVARIVLLSPNRSAITVRILAFTFVSLGTAPCTAGW